MTKESELTAAFWKHLRSDRTVMLGLDATAPVSLRPMTAVPDGTADSGPIWFFTMTDSAIVDAMASRAESVFTFTSKGHEVFATVHGALTRSDDRSVIDRVWTPMIAAWYDGGKSDPKLALLRFDPARAEIWRDATGFLAGLELLFGADPQAKHEDNVARVSLA